MLARKRAISPKTGELNRTFSMRMFLSSQKAL